MQASASAHACHFYPIAKIFCLIITLGSNLVLDLRREATGRALLKWVTVVGGRKRLHLARGVRALSFQPQGEDACQILRDGFPGQLRGAGRACGASGAKSDWVPQSHGSALESCSHCLHLPPQPLGTGPSARQMEATGSCLIHEGRCAHSRKGARSLPGAPATEAGARQPPF